MTPRQLRQIIETALRDKASEKAAELEKEGMLKAFLDSRVEAAMQEIEDAENPAVTAVYQSDLPYLERVQKLTEARKRAQSAAIAHAIEF